MACKRTSIADGTIDKSFHGNARFVIPQDQLRLSRLQDNLLLRDRRYLPNKVGLPLEDESPFFATHAGCLGGSDPRRGCSHFTRSRLVRLRASPYPLAYNP
jgi:hypothetical protein